MYKSKILLAVLVFASLAVFAVVVSSALGKRGACTAGEKAEQARVVNTHCPIMGSKLDPANVPDSLTRVHKDQKVGFCCAGCLPAWDKLTDEEKDKKLAGTIKKD